ncbi:TetR/AcrR family transcriptional regulator [Tabrizicola sp.]|uniref:TetR/AcrR family transcriptional regulator n=1 Tax=Tabrizicola sp. TaxID=2005166 RepID=UPI002736B597|nr:TetR/AcrR family transcriptional regulator [Tabrizicola sp.]MDP3194748.1 TetR/AcrR family transcriptional regulator [Tabrizicola sp.]
MTTIDPPRRPGLTRDLITQAALTLADARGVDSLSMRALAKELGVEAMSLYNHIRNKDDLLGSVVDAVVGRIALPSAGSNWQDELRARAHSMRTVFLAHPWAPPLIVGRINVGPNALALMDATLGCLRAAGFSYVQADHAMIALDSLIYGFHLLERSMPVEPENYADAANTYLPAIDADRYPHFCALGQMVADGSYDGVNHMAFGLDLLLEALEAQRRG